MTRITALAAALLCALFAMPASAQYIFAGIRSIDVTMHGVETCIASHYGIGDGYHGRRTASGERFNTNALTAAHCTRRFGSHVTVTNRANGRSVGCGSTIAVRSSMVGASISATPLRERLAWVGWGACPSNEQVAAGATTT